MKPKIQIEYRKLDELKKLENNPRTIKKKDFETLKESIKNNQDYFEARPLILSDRTGELVIIAGNQRFEAAKSLKMTEVPTVLLQGLTAERERELIIRDNINNGDWNFDELLNGWDVDMLSKWGLDNIKKSISDEKDFENDPPQITTSYITMDYVDEIALPIKEATAKKLMEQMIQYKNEHGSYNGFWDERLKDE